MRLPISAIVITLNEENNISRCLNSLAFCEETIVVDSHSSDATARLARQMGARVIEWDWQGFGLQKKLATQEARFAWVLFVDADEVVSPELASELESAFSTLDPTTTYGLPRKSFHLGRWILHGGWYPDLQYRLFHRDFSNWNEAPLHEKVISKQYRQMQHPLLHLVFKDLSHQVLTNDKYSTLGAKQLHNKGEVFSFLKLLYRPFGKFFECYVLKQGFRDGLPGFIIAIGAAYSLFLRYAKLWEICEAKSWETRQADLREVSSE